MDKIEEPLEEKGQLEFLLETQGDQVYIFPFLLNKTFNEQPFKEDQRLYSVNFGYPIQDTYLISIDLNDKFEIAELPANKKYSLPNNAGLFSVSYKEAEGQLNCNFMFQLNQYSFDEKAYEY